MNILKVGDKVKPNLDSMYWKYPSWTQKDLDSVYTIRKTIENHYIYWHVKEDYNCLPSDLILVDQEWD